MHRSMAAAFVLLTANIAASATAEDTTASGVRFFEFRIRPLLVKHCYKCHGPKKQESELRLDTATGLFSGGSTGRAVVPGKPGGSLLITAVGYRDADLRMPPNGKLSKREIDDLTAWVKVGAPHPGGVGAIRPKGSSIDYAAGREFWSFRPTAHVSIPAVKNAAWPAGELDRLLLAGLEAKGISPAPPADKRTLIRRATFDLIGLPPTPAEVAAFLADDAPQAFARVVDRLLASPQYGERWGRHWLDVARYADSNGLDENIAHGNAWRYRDYVIAAFNSDKPFDRFVVEQLAGDRLHGSDSASRRERLIATGYLSLGPKVLAEVDERKMEMDIVDEQIDAVGRAFLGLTLGCARCHDHKFDPIAQADYYALAGIFKSTQTMDSFTKIARWHENEIATPEQTRRRAAHNAKVAALGKRIEAVKKLMDSQPNKAEIAKLEKQLAALKQAAPQVDSAMGVIDGKVHDVSIHVRGSHLTLGETVARHFPRVIAGEKQPPLSGSSSGRLELARWIASPKNPLTARVIVNRVWRWHFGRGLVPTTDNFGKQGERPVNAALLDWLAGRFIADGWSIKNLHRRIMLSAAYRMSSRHDPKAAGIDPENRLQWRANVRRIEAESFRDSVLAVSGRLDRSMGGSMLHVENRKFLFDHTSKDETSYGTQRRSVYLPVIRNHLYDVFTLFDYTDASVPNGNRTAAGTAPQALFVLNGKLTLDAAERMTDALLTLRSDERKRIELAYERVFGRPATSAETDRAWAFVRRLKNDPMPEAERRAWRLLCQALLASNEFVYVR